MSVRRSTAAAAAIGFVPLVLTGLAATRATAPHRGSFALYITKAGYDPAKPLKWADLEATPFLTVTDPTLAGGSYVFSGKVPQRSGRHLIYSIWQRSDSPEAFYTCSDVV